MCGAPSATYISYLVKEEILIDYDDEPMMNMHFSIVLFDLEVEEEDSGLMMRAVLNAKYENKIEG